MSFGGEHSGHYPRYGQAPRGRQSGASGWPPAPAPKRARDCHLRRSPFRTNDARAPQPGNVSVLRRAFDQPDNWRIPPNIKVDPFIEGNQIAVAASLPIARHTRLHQKTLVLVIGIRSNLSRERRTRPHGTHPFCQDEKTRLPAEMLRLDN